jgi:TrbL/VirB6 plasmid conjugal transfer protein
MNGTTLFQTLYASYHDQAVLIAGQTSNQLLNSMLPTMRDLIGLFVVIAGAGAIMGRVDRGEAIARIVRVIIVASLMSTANWNTFVVQTATNIIPDQMSTAIAGGGGVSLKGAAGFDGLANAVDNFEAQVQSQAVGWWRIAERIKITLAAWMAKFMIFLTFVVWLTAQASIAFLIPLGAILAPLALFRATEGYFARWIAKIVSLELVGVLSLMLASFVVQADAKMMQSIGHPVPASKANQSLEMNAGALSFTGFDIPGSGPLALGAPPPAGGGSTLNLDMSIAALWNLVLSYAFGSFLLLIITGIAMFIGSSHGFTATPVINMMIASAQRGGAMASRGAAAAVGRR